MKLLVISDTHGRLEGAAKALKRLEGKIGGVFHLGDMAADAKTLEAACGVPFRSVGGNCDFYYSAESLEARKLIEINGVKILLVHGHEDGVKHGYSCLAARAKKEGAQVALCGHTHEPYNSVVDGVLIVNPGSASFPRGRARVPSYAVLDISDDGSFSAGVVELRL